MISREAFLKLGIAVLFTSFLVLGLMLASSATKAIFQQTGYFTAAFWNYRRLDVYIQIMLIFTSSLGILTFFAEKEDKK